VPLHAGSAASETPSASHSMRCRQVPNFPVSPKSRPLICLPATGAGPAMRRAAVSCFRLPDAYKEPGAKPTITRNAMLRDLVSDLRDRLFPDRTLREVSRQVYGAVVAQSRDPRFYLDFGFPDTVTGRFDVLCLHVFLVANRLAGEADGEARRLSQAVFDCFSAETDRALREIGIGDSSVPKRKKKLLHGFYGQVDEFAGPLGEGDAARLALAVTARFGLASNQAEGLARYMIAARDRLRDRPLADVRSAALAFPDPGSVAP